MAPLTFTIGGVDRTTMVQVQTLAITDILNSRNTCKFTMEDPTGAYKPVIGASILIKNGATTIFAGTIEDWVQSDLTPEVGPGLQWEIDGVDFNQLADRFQVAKAYSAPGQTAKDIITDLWSTYLQAEGVTMTGVDTGPTVESAVWNYLPLATALQDLADLAGYAWWIDYNKDLHFASRADNPAPFALTDTSANFRALKVTKSRTNYRNYQIVRAGTDLAPSRTDHAAGDGKTRAFVVTYPVGLAPTACTLNGIAKTIGVQGVDTGMDFYYQIGSNIISQDGGAALLVSTDDLAVTYQGQIPIIIVAQLDAEEAARAAVEGGTGQYQETEYYPNVNSNASAQQIANGLLQKFGMVPVVVDFETDEDGLFSGQLIPITNTKHGLSGTYLISKVTFGDFTGLGNLRYQVEVQDGQFLGSWESFFRYIAAIGRKYVIRENEVVVYLRTAGYLTGVGVNASEALTQNNVLTAVGATASESLDTPDSFPPESRTDIALTNQSETITGYVLLNSGGKLLRNDGGNYYFNALV